MKRAIRRAHQERILQKRLKQFSWFLKYHSIEWLKKLRDNPKRCSCPMCGNPRKHFGHRTRQEILAEINEEEHLDEMEKELE